MASFYGKENLSLPLTKLINNDQKRWRVPQESWRTPWLGAEMLESIKQKEDIKQKKRKSFVEGGREMGDISFLPTSPEKKLDNRVDNF